jgi:hypothetical protein
MTLKIIYRELPGFWSGHAHGGSGLLVAHLSQRRVGRDSQPVAVAIKR